MSSKLDGLASFFARLLSESQLLETNHVLRERLAAMEQQLGSHNKDIQSIYRVLQRLLAEPAKPKPSMGFKKPR